MNNFGVNNLLPNKLYSIDIISVKHGAAIFTEFFAKFKGRAQIGGEVLIAIGALFAFIPHRAGIFAIIAVLICKI